MSFDNHIHPHARSTAWKRQIGVVWGGEAISVLTSSILQMGFIWHIMAQTNSASMVALASAAGFLPLALIGPFTGVIVDRYPIKITLITADLSIAAVSLVALLFAIAGDLPVWMVVIALFLRAIGSSLHTPAFNSLTPMIAPPEALGRLSGISQGVQSGGYIVGAALAAVIYPLFGLGAMVALDVAGALFASIAVLSARLEVGGRQEESQTAEATAQSSPGIAAAMARIWRESLDGLRVLRADKGLFSLLLCGFMFTLALSPISALFPVLCISHFHSGTTGAATAEMLFSIGMLVCSALIGFTGGLRSKVASVVLATVVFGAATVVGGLAGSGGFLLFLAMSFVMGFSSPLYSAPSIALIQQRISPEYLGRVFGLYGSLMAWALPIGTAASSLFVDRVGAPIWFVGSGALMLALAAITWLIPSIRHLERD